MDVTKMRLGDTLISLGLITDEQLKYALNKQKTSGGKRLGEILVEENIITQQQLIDVLKTKFGVESIDLRSIKLDPSIVKLLPENLARRHKAVPIKISDGKLIVAMSDPLDRPALAEIGMITQKPTQAVLVSPSDIKYAIDVVFSDTNANKAADEYMRIQSSGADFDDNNLDINSAPIVKLVTSLIESGVRMKASDIHIEPEVDKMRVRMRIDGVLYETLSISNKPHNAIVSRIKIMANMNISEKRIPQDGRILTEVDGREIDLRVATIPSTQGEKVVIRILDKQSLVEGIHNLGLSESGEEKFKSIINRPYGMVLVTGPTGSGKTTTLYTVLMSLNNVNRNIVTIEDPVEYDIPGIYQTQVNPKAGLTFATGLRGFMRADPDVVMVGEIRDEETADVAVNAALTGHLVLSTLHTNDSVGAVARMVEMGVKPYILASSLSGVIAQRLVRKICPHCKTEYEATLQDKLAIGLPEDKDYILYKGAGCENCNDTGYKGRIGVFEILPISNELRNLITKDTSTNKLFEAAKKEGLVTLREDGVDKVLRGVTTVQEVLRIT